jgi:hypothetical protein
VCHRRVQGVLDEARIARLQRGGVQVDRVGQGPIHQDLRLAPVGRLVRDPGDVEGVVDGGQAGRGARCTRVPQGAPGCVCDILRAPGAGVGEGAGVLLEDVDLEGRARLPVAKVAGIVPGSNPEGVGVANPQLWGLRPWP